MAHELGRHADAGVLDGKFVGRISADGAGLFHQVDDDIPAHRREFDGVAHNVDQDLVQAQLVRDHVLVLHVLGVDIEIQLSGVDQPLDHGPQVVEQVRHVHGLFLQLHAAAFNAAHVQDVVDQAQQMGAGGVDLCKIVLDLLGVVDVGLGQGGEAHDGVHGGADIVGHAVEEHGLGLVRLLRRRERQGELILLLPQLPVLFPLRLQGGLRLFLLLLQFLVRPLQPALGGDQVLAELDLAHKERHQGRKGLGIGLKGQAEVHVFVCGGSGHQDKIGPCQEFQIFAEFFVIAKEQPEHHQQGGDGRDVGQPIVVPSAVAVAGVKGIKPPEMQVQGQRADGHGLKGPVGFQHDPRLLVVTSDQVPQEDRKGQGYKIIGNEGNVIAAFRKEPPEQAGDPVEGPRDRIAEQPGDAYDHEDLGDFFLLQFILE